MTITNRLHSLARTLGNTFFSLDVLEPMVANGENVLDPESYKDVSPDRFLRLEKELVRGKAEVVGPLVSQSSLISSIDCSRQSVCPNSLVYLYKSIGSTRNSDSFHLLLMTLVPTHPPSPRLLVHPNQQLRRQTHSFLHPHRLPDLVPWAPARNHWKLNIKEHSLVSLRV